MPQVIDSIEFSAILHRHNSLILFMFQTFPGFMGLILSDGPFFQDSNFRGNSVQTDVIGLIELVIE